MSCTADSRTLPEVVLRLRTAECVALAGGDVDLLAVAADGHAVAAVENPGADTAGGRVLEISQAAAIGRA